MSKPLIVLLNCFCFLMVAKVTRLPILPGRVGTVAIPADSDNLAKGPARALGSAAAGRGLDAGATRLPDLRLGRGLSAPLSSLRRVSTEVSC